MSEVYSLHQIHYTCQCVTYDGRIAYCETINSALSLYWQPIDVDRGTSRSVRRTAMWSSLTSTNCVDNTQCIYSTVRATHMYFMYSTSITHVLYVQNAHHTYTLCTEHAHTCTLCTECASHMYFMYSRYITHVLYIQYAYHTYTVYTICTSHMHYTHSTVYNMYSMYSRLVFRFTSLCIELISST